jgi:hypothetical protein
MNLPGPGLTQHQYLDLLAAGHHTGWWDEHGDPAPWPEDFLDPDSDWQPSGGDANPPDPSQAPF